MKRILLSFYLTAFIATGFAQNGKYAVVSNSNAIAFVVATSIEESIKTGSLTVTPTSNPSANFDTALMASLLADQTMVQSGADLKIKASASSLNPKSVIISESTIAVKDNSGASIRTYRLTGKEKGRKDWLFVTSNGKQITLRRTGGRDYTIWIEGKELNLKKR